MRSACIILVGCIIKLGHGLDDLGILACFHIYDLVTSAEKCRIKLVVVKLSLVLVEGDAGDEFNRVSGIYFDTLSDGVKIFHALSNHAQPTHLDTVIMDTLVGTIVAEQWPCVAIVPRAIVHYLAQVRLFVTHLACQLTCVLLAQAL